MGNLEPLARTYPAGVTSWVEVALSDVGAGKEFYGGLFGWRFDGLAGDPRRSRRRVCRRRPIRPGGLGDVRRRRRRRRHEASDGRPSAPSWSPRRRTPARPDARPPSATRRARRSGCGRRAMRLGAQLTNSPVRGTSATCTPPTRQRRRASTTRSSAGGWSTRAGAWRSRCRGTATTSRPPSTPTSRPQGSAPEGFEDVIGGLAPAEDGEPNHWHVTFSVADRDASAALVRRSVGGYCAARTTGPGTRWSGTRRACSSRSASSPRRSGRRRPTTISP